MSDNFHKLVEASDVMQVKAEAAKAQVRAHARSMGLELGDREIEDMGSFRLAVLAGVPLEGEGYERDLLALPSMQAERDKERTRAALVKGDEDTVDKIGKMSRADRINYARANGLDRPVAEAEPTADEEARVLRAISALPAAARMSAWRKYKGE